MNDKFVIGYNNYPPPGLGNIEIDLDSDEFINIGPQANCTLGLCNTTGPCHACTDANTNVHVALYSNSYRYGYGPNEDGYYHARGGTAEWRPYHPLLFAMRGKSNSPAITGYAENCQQKGLCDEPTMQAYRQKYRQHTVCHVH